MKGFILGAITVLAATVVFSKLKSDKETMKEVADIAVEKAANTASKVVAWAAYNSDKVEAIGAVVTVVIDILTVKKLIEEKHSRATIDEMNTKLDQLMLLMPKDYSVAYE